MVIWQVPVKPWLPSRSWQRQAKGRPSLTFLIKNFACVHKLSMHHHTLPAKSLLAGVAHRKDKELFCFKGRIPFSCLMGLMAIPNQNQGAVVSAVQGRVAPLPAHNRRARSSTGNLLPVPGLLTLFCFSLEKKKKAKKHPWFQESLFPSHLSSVQNMIWISSFSV